MAMTTAMAKPRNRLRRHVTIAMQASTDSHGRPTTKTDRPSVVATMTFTAADVVRTRMYIIRAGDASAVAGVNGEIFGEIRPASTLVTVAGLIDPSMLVEVELEARRG